LDGWRTAPVAAYPATIAALAIAHDQSRDVGIVLWNCTIIVKEFDLD
jgi:hypothetical protein